MEHDHLGISGVDSPARRSLGPQVLHHPHPGRHLKDDGYSAATSGDQVRHDRSPRQVAFAPYDLKARSLVTEYPRIPAPVIGNGGAGRFQLSSYGHVLRLPAAPFDVAKLHKLPYRVLPGMSPAGSNFGPAPITCAGFEGWEIRPWARCRPMESGRTDTTISSFLCARTPSEVGP